MTRENPDPDALLETMRHGDPSRMGDPLIVNEARLRTRGIHTLLEDTGIFSSLSLLPEEEAILTGIVAANVAQREAETRTYDYFRIETNPFLSLIKGAKQRYLRVVIEEIIDLRTVGMVIRQTSLMGDAALTVRKPARSALVGAGLTLVTLQLGLNHPNDHTFGIYRDARETQEWITTWHPRIEAARGESASHALHAEPIHLI